MWAETSPSLAPYTAAGVAAGAQPGMAANGALLRPGGTDTATAVQEELAAGFALTPGHTAPQSNAGATSRQQWAAASPEPHAPSPSPPTSRGQVGPPAAASTAAAAAAALDLERGMASSWQGPSDAVPGNKAGVAPPPGMMGAGAGVGVASETIGAAAAAAAAVLGSDRSGGLTRGQQQQQQQAGVARQEEAKGGGVERSQGVPQQQQQQRRRQQPVAPTTAAGPVAARQVRMATSIRSLCFICCTAVRTPYTG